MPLNLPPRASYEFLKKLAKERLAALRVAVPTTKLATAQLSIARDYGFSSWRALKAEVDQRRGPNVAEFIRACTAGDVEAIEGVLRTEPSLARERVASGSTGLHLSFRHPAALRLLLQYGADPNARDIQDNATPLHFAAGHGNVESVRILLDAGADVHGNGDVHDGGVIGWAARKDNQAVVALLVGRGARHHIFSAMALGDRALVEQLVEDNPDCLSRRRSRFECGQTPVHAAFAPPDGLGFLAGEPDYAMLELLIELGADIEATDDRGRRPIDVALLRGDEEAIRILTAAGAVPPKHIATAAGGKEIAEFANSVKKSVPMFGVPDMRATVQWYQAIGFALVGEYEDAGDLVFARLSFGKCEITLTSGATSAPQGVSLWFYVDRVEDLYHRLRERQATHDIRFDEDLYVPFYGGRQFSIRDNNGLTLIFWQPEWMPSKPASTTV